MTSPLRKILTALWAGMFAATLGAEAKQVSIHDPAMAQEGSTTYLFSTGPGITFYSSHDRRTWQRRGRVFPGEPAWARSVAPGFNGHIWAPDILYHAGRYYLYYSVSAFGINTSAIGVATNRTLDPDADDYRWEDQGPILESVPYRDLWNAIDPQVILADDGTPWMSFGSFWGGLKLVKLAPDLISLAEPQVWHTLAKRERSGFVDDADPGPAAVEAPFIFKHAGSYYLFASWDKCCRGAESTYKLVVGRASDLTGPYLDRDGRDLAQGGGTVLLAGDAAFAGVGHNSVYTLDGQDMLVCHAYETADHGLQKLKIIPLTWDESGWPQVPPDALSAYVSTLEN